MPNYVLNTSRLQEKVYKVAKDLYNKGVTKANVLAKLIQKFPRHQEHTLRAHRDYVVGRWHSVVRLNQSGNSRPIGEVLESSRVRNVKIVRVEYTFQFLDAKRGAYRTAGFSMDVDPSMTKLALQQLIRQKMNEWLATNYPLRLRSGQIRLPPVKSFSIDSMEGF